MILVTGGAGYIGSHTVQELLRNGYEVVVLDNLCQGHREAVLTPHLEEVDLGDTPAVQRVFQTYPIEAVIHFAAFASVGESHHHPQLYFHNNVKNTLSLLDCMMAAKVGHFVFSSSCSVYGNPQYTPLDERHPLNPINAYAESKRMVERILAYYHTAYQLYSVSLRYFNACGADIDGRLGESHHPETHLIPLALNVATGKRTHIDIYGTDYPTPDGSCIRDYIHVTDLAGAHIQALRFLKQGEDGAFVFNLGTGSGYSVKEIIETCRAVTGHPIPVKEGPRRPGDPSILVAQADLTAQQLGWAPQHSDLNTIIQTAWHWERHKRF